MSLKQAVWDQLGDEFQIVSVKVDDETVHGEKGQSVTVLSRGVEHVVFLADSRKIKEDHAVSIIRSYLRNDKER